MSVDHTKNIIEVTNVSFSYFGKNDDEVLKDINLNIHQGDYLGIIGPNGGGKTTLLKLMLGLLKLTQGNIKLFGQDIQDFKNWAEIGYVPQKVVNFDNNFPATVLEVVSMGRFGKIGLLNFPSKNDSQKVHQALKQVGMLDYKDRLIGDLSGGQQQRVFIARSLAAEPKIIFLDEPTTGIDQKTQDEFYDLLQYLNKQMDITLVVVSHDMDIVAKEVTELACINKTLVYEGSPKEFFSNQKLLNLYGKGVKFLDHTHHGH